MIPHRLSAITPFLVMDVLERAQAMERTGTSIIHLEVGEPDFVLPGCIGEAFKQAVDDGRTHYTHSLGDVRLREAVCAHYAERYGVTVTPDRVAITSGTSPALLLCFSVLLNPGDRALLTDPHYACYPNFIRYLGGIPTFVPVSAADGFQPDPELLRSAINPETRAILVNSPSNPTGTVLSPDRMRAIADLGLPVISDEIYHGLVYEGRESSMLEFTDRAFVLNGFSKLYAMTGLRLGYIIFPAEYMRAIQVLQQNFFISASSAAQHAGIAALREAGPDAERMRQAYDERRRFMIRRLRELGFSIPVEPTGAFYVFVDARHLGRDSYRLAFDILDRAHVGVAPGIDFGSHGEGHLRFSYANSLENIAEGLNRLERYLHLPGNTSSGQKP